MSKFLKAFAMPILTALCGAVGAGLQVWLLGTVDEKGLLAGGHIGQILLWILSIGVTAGLLFLTRPLVHGPKYSFNFPPSFIGGIGAMVAAAGVAFTAATMLLSKGDMLTTLTALAGFAGTICLVLSGTGRWKGMRMNVIVHSVVCVFFLLLLICQYRMWSSEPELQRYVFQLIATVLLMIGVYQRACFDGAMGSRKSYAFFRLTGAYFCFLAIPGSDLWLLYLTALVWSLTDLCNLTPMNQKGR